MSIYKIYLDGLLLPMGTDKLETNIDDRDDETELINGEVISVPKAPGLTTWKFTTLVAPYKINGACYDAGLVVTDTVLEKLESLKTSKKPFQFIVIRNGTLGGTNTTVTVQSYKRSEASDKSTFSEIEIQLRAYKSHQNTSITIELPKKPEIEDDKYLEYEDEIKRLEDMNPPKYYTVTTIIRFIKLFEHSPTIPVEQMKSWFDIGKELFGNSNYGYGIRNTNNLHWNKGANSDFPESEYPGSRYPAIGDTLVIDVSEIVRQTNLVLQSPVEVR